MGLGLINHIHRMAYPTHAGILGLIHHTIRMAYPHVDILELYINHLYMYIGFIRHTRFGDLSTKCWISYHGDRIQHRMLHGGLSTKGWISYHGDRIQHRMVHGDLFNIGCCMGANPQKEG